MATNTKFNFKRTLPIPIKGKSPRDEHVSLLDHSESHKPYHTYQHSSCEESKHEHYYTHDDDEKWYENLLIVGAVALFISLTIGVSFYTIFNDWPWTTALLAATTALLGPIFDMPQQPHADPGYAFTLLYFIYGQSLFVWTISEVVARLIKRAPQIEARERQKLFEMYELEDLDNDGMIGWSDYITYQWKMLPYYIGWEYHKHKIYVFIGLVCWIILGIWYCMHYVGYSGPSALYFIFSTLSQMGLATPPCDDKEVDPTMCVYDPYMAIFLSIYVIIGVPLFAYAVGMVAGILIERSIRAEEKAILLTPLSKEEYNFACKLYGDDDTLSLAEFTILELLRLQRVKMEDLEDIRELFAAIDEETTGNVTKPMLAQRNLLRKYGSFDDIDFYASRRANEVPSPTRSVQSSLGASTHPEEPEFSHPPIAPFLRHMHTEPTYMSTARSPGGSLHTSDYNTIDTESKEESSREMPDMMRRISFSEYNEIVLPMAIDWALPGLTESEDFHLETIEEEEPELFEWSGMSV